MSLFVYGFNAFFDVICTHLLGHFHIALDFNYLIPIGVATGEIALACFAYYLLEKHFATRMLFLGK